MIKAAPIFLGLAALVFLPGTSPAQDNAVPNPAPVAAMPVAAMPAADSAAISAADTEAILRQANTLVLRQKLIDAKALEQRDVAGSAKIYQDCCDLAAQIGSGIPDETLQAVAGLTATRLALARDAQARGDYPMANTQVQQIINAERTLRVAPNENDVVAFKKHNDDLLDLYKGRLPDAETADKIPSMAAQKTAASTLVQDGKIYYEAGQFDQAEAKLNQAIALDPDNTTATYYLNLIKQAEIARDSAWHNTDTQTRMEHVEKQWILPKPTANLPVPNAYATNDLVFTGAGRQAIMAKLDKIHLDNVSFDGLPLSAVLDQLGQQCRLRDPERKGVNFLINNNPDLSGQPIASSTAIGVPGIGGGGIAGRAPTLDPNTGLPVAPAADTGTGSEQQDIGSSIIKIPSLTDVRLADVLDAIVLVADHKIKYSIEDFAVVFSPKADETPQLFMRTFRVDPNTFYSGLANVSSYGLGISSSGGSSGGGGGGGGGSSSGNQFSTPVGVVLAFSGAGQNRQSGSSQGGGGGGGGGGTSGSGGLNQNIGAGAGVGGTAGGAVGGAGGQNAGGLDYVTTLGTMTTPSAAARAFFTVLGVNLLQPPGKSVFFNDRLGYLFVKATESDLDTIERALQVLNQVPPQVHIKARFIEVDQSDNNALGFDWYLGQFSLGNQVVGTGGTSPSLTVPVSTANPLGAFPGSSTASLIGPAATDQSLFQSGLSSAPTIATFTGILTNPNFRVALQALSQRTGVETLGEPEITTLSGRQTQMRATTVQTIVVGVSFQAAPAATGIPGTTP